MCLPCFAIHGRPQIKYPSSCIFTYYLWQSYIIIILSPERPIISELTGESPVNQGATLKVSCQVTGSPAPSISWWRDEIRLMPSLNGRISFPLHNTVWVQFATAEDAGIYKCVASNPAGTEAKSLPILIIGKVYVLHEKFTIKNCRMSHLSLM